MNESDLVNSVEVGTPAARPWSIEPHGRGAAIYSGRDTLHHGMRPDEPRRWRR
jgi:hypothetical protein